MRHVLGIAGVLAASVLLVVSAMMNYQFGYSLGKTPTDSHIYGMASAAADCFKALAPFFFFAAIRNRVWSQALAAVLVWVVVTGYAFTSALGHAALNRFTTSGERVVASASYKDTRAELKRAEDQLKWIPPHRPPSTVEAELNVLKAQRSWLTSKECTDATIRSSREFCQQYFKLAAEHASGQEAEKYRARIGQLSAQASRVTGAAVMGEADPQAGVIARLTGLEIGTVQTSLMLFVALLIEIGSGFGMYVAFAYWRPHQNMHGGSRPASTAAEVQPARREEEAPATDKADPVWSSDPSAGTTDGDAAASGPPPARPFGDNDNRSAKASTIMPPNDVQRFYQDCVEGGAHVPASSYVTSSDLNEAYILWCGREDREPLPLPNFTKDFDKLKVQKQGGNNAIGGGVKYFAIALRPEVAREVEESKKLKKLEKKAARKRKALQATEAALAEPRRAADDADIAAERLRAAAGAMRDTLAKPDAPADKPAKAA